MDDIDVALEAQGPTYTFSDGNKVLISFINSKK